MVIVRTLLLYNYNGTLVVLRLSVFKLVVRDTIKLYHFLKARKRSLQSCEWVPTISTVFLEKLGMNESLKNLQLALKSPEFFHQPRPSKLCHSHSNKGENLWSNSRTIHSSA